MTSRFAPRIVLQTSSLCHVLKRGECPFEILRLRTQELCGTPFSYVDIAYHEETLYVGELSGRKDAWRVPFGRAHMNNLPTREFSDRSLPDVMLGVCVIARNSKTEQVLVAKRGASAMTFPNTFVYPGGHIEPGESLQACGSREIREETNIDVNQDSLRPVCLWLSTYPERLPMKAQHLVLVLEGTAASSEIRIDPAELDQALWMTPQQVVELAHTDDANNDFRIVPEGHLFATHLLLESQGTSAQHR